MITFNLRRRNRLALVLAIPLLLGASADPLRDRAFELYDAGEFDQARVLLEQLAEAGQADGIVMYRLYYCRQRIQHPETRATLERARGLLEERVGASPDLEAYFYLANALGKLEQGDEAQRVAAEATRRFEAGELPEPVVPLEMFRLGKLYADQNRAGGAVRWYGRAVDGFEANRTSGASRPYLLWASRYLAEQAYAGERYEEAARHFERLLADEQGTFEDWDRYAVAQAGIGRYAGAARAWRRANRLAPGQADRAHYGYGVAERAASTGKLAEAAPDGRSWDELDQAELERILVEQADVVRQAVTWRQNLRHRLHFIEQLALEHQILEARKVFLAAALQFVLRGYPLREKAFAAGYAGLIFREAAWRLREPRAGRPGRPASGS